MDKPTAEQIKEFWEWCGFSFTDPYWRHPKGWYFDSTSEGFVRDGTFYSRTPPYLDLNNLFNAVSKDLRVEFVPDGDNVECSLIYKYPTPSDNWLDHQYSWRIKGSGTSSTKALALFWALWQALKKELKDG